MEPNLIFMFIILISVKIISVTIVCYYIIYRPKLRFYEPYTEQLHLVTYENTDHENIRHLRATCKQYGWNLTVLGKNETWIGFGTKIFKYTEHMKTLPDNDIIVIIDARDVLINDTSKTFLNRLKQFDIKNKIICSAEGGCCSIGEPAVSPALKAWMEDISTHDILKFLNTGMICSKVKNMKKIYPFDMKSEGQDDQNAAVIYWSKHPYAIVLDNHEKLFSNSMFSPNSEGYLYHKNHWISYTTTMRPVFIQTQSKNWKCYDKLVNKIPKEFYK